VALLDFLLPPTCAGCGRYGAVLCGSCLASLTPLDGGSGPDAFVRPDPGMVVGESLRLASAAFAHQGPLRKALARLKYEGLHRLAGPIAERIAEKRLNIPGLPEETARRWRDECVILQLDLGG
jgi:predicted amidophosphoribosyltransferase